MSSADRLKRAQSIARSGGLVPALAEGAMDQHQDVTLSEALVLGLLKQGVRKYIGVFGHGSTDLGEVLRVYEGAGLVQVFNVRNEVEASHAATALRWQYGETAAVFTSIGPGAMHAIAGSLVPLSNGLGVYYLFGDETTHDEGFNMQQIPRHEQLSFLKLASTMGTAYTLHTPQALPAALRRGANSVFSPEQPAPCYLFLPMNVQGALIEGFNLAELPALPSYPRAAAFDDEPYREAAALIRSEERIMVKVGNGGRGVSPDLLDEFLRRTGAVFVHGPSAVGILPASHPRNMTVGGAKGSISGNFAMAEARLVITVGARAVCQWDSSGTAWKNAQAFISINTRYEDAGHYNRTLPLVGDAGAVLERLVEVLRREGIDRGGDPSPRGVSSGETQSPQWLRDCSAKRAEWDELCSRRAAVEPLNDAKWGRSVLTQPAAIRTVVEFSDRVGAVKYFDAGDVQANGFQLVEDDRVGRTFTDTGASYMGFATSGILSAAFADKREYPIAFTGDGSFMMNPQLLIDAVEHGLRGMIVLFDNRRMAAISSLQTAQYGFEFKTDDGVEVDYVLMARSVSGVKGLFGGWTIGELRQALETAHAFDGLSLVHVPVYAGDDERGGLGVYGDWNVGSWCDDVQKEKHRLGF